MNWVVDGPSAKFAAADHASAIGQFAQLTRQLPIVVSHPFNGPDDLLSVGLVKGKCREITAMVFERQADKANIPKLEGLAGGDILSTAHIQDFVRPTSAQGLPSVEFTHDSKPAAERQAFFMIGNKEHGMAGTNTGSLIIGPVDGNNIIPQRIYRPDGTMVGPPLLPAPKS